MAKHHLEAIDLIKQNKWDQAHAIVQQYNDSLSSLIHAYLHKLEGDLPNAAYWYRHAGESDPGTDHVAELVSLHARARSDTAN